MKSVIVCLLLLLTVVTLVVGQNNAQPNKKDQPFSNGLEKETLSRDHAFFQKIAREMRYPAVAQRAMKVGNVYAEFIVDKEGKISNISVLNAEAVDPALAEEVTRTIAALPVQNPAYIGDYVLPVSFQLEDKSGSTVKAPETRTASVSEALKTKFVLQDMVIVGYK